MPPTSFRRLCSVFVSLDFKVEGIGSLGRSIDNKDARDESEGAGGGRSSPSPLLPPNFPLSRLHERAHSDPPLASRTTSGNGGGGGGGRSVGSGSITVSTSTPGGRLSCGSGSERMVTRPSSAGVENGAATETATATAATALGERSDGGKIMSARLGVESGTMSAGPLSLDSAAAAAVYPGVLSTVGLGFERTVASTCLDGREKTGAPRPATAPAGTVTSGGAFDQEEQPPASVPALLANTTPPGPATQSRHDDNDAGDSGTLPRSSSDSVAGKGEEGKVEGTSAVGGSSDNNPDVGNGNGNGNGSASASASASVSKKRKSLSPARQRRAGGGGSGSTSNRLPLADQDLVLPEPCREEGLTGDEQASEVADVLLRYVCVWQHCPAVMSLFLLFTCAISDTLPMYLSLTC